MRGDRYIEIPGSKTHELPPLLVHPAGEPGADLTSVLVEAEEMLAATDANEEVVEQRKFDLACQLTERYRGVLSHWLWGDSILEWIRQCEITFEGEDTLRKLLHPDVWPHASRSSFVELLREKASRASSCSSWIRRSPTAPIMPGRISPWAYPRSCRRIGFISMCWMSGSIS
jgi:hypothetical protein